MVKKNEYVLKKKGKKKSWTRNENRIVYSTQHMYKYKQCNYKQRGQCIVINK